MARSSPTTAEILLDLLEIMSLSAASPRQLAADLRERHPGSVGLGSRVKSALDILEAEGLAETTNHLGRRLHRTTAAGLHTLEEQGRYPNGAAVLFTDLVGSTALIGTFGEAQAHELRLRHFALLRAAVVKHGGREVKGLGDGLMIVFSGAAAALACGVAMQRSVAADNDGLGLRVGVHVGPLLRENDDFHGTTVIVAARLCDRAKTGQMLVSGDALAAAQAAEAKPVTEFIGELDLKGLDAPMPTYEIVWAPAPRS